jgi:cytochrome P450
MLVSKLDGVPISDEDIITICLTFMATGLDTTRAALGYIFQHLSAIPTCGTA